MGQFDSHRLTAFRQLRANCLRTPGPRSPAIQYENARGKWHHADSNPPQRVTKLLVSLRGLTENIRLIVGGSRNPKIYKAGFSRSSSMQAERSCIRNTLSGHVPYLASCSANSQPQSKVQQIKISSLSHRVLSGARQRFQSQHPRYIDRIELRGSTTTTPPTSQQQVQTSPPEPTYPFTDSTGTREFRKSTCGKDTNPLPKIPKIVEYCTSCTFSIQCALQPKAQPSWVVPERKRFGLGSPSSPNVANLLPACWHPQVRQYLSPELSSK